MIRTYKLEDKDYIINFHYELYNREFGYDLTFRDFIADSVNGFIERAETDETIFILEIEGTQSGSISIKKVNDTTAQLGLFLIEPHLRGSGYGEELVEKAINFSKEKGFKRIILGTNTELQSARHLYRKNGFEIINIYTQILSNKELLEEEWELILENEI